MSLEGELKLLKNKLSSEFSSFQERMDRAERAQPSHCRGSELEGIRADFSVFKKEIMSCFLRLEARVASVENRLDEADAYSRRNCLLVHGIVEDGNEVCTDVVLNFLNKAIKCSSKFDIRSIDNCHRLSGGTRKDSPRPIVVRFCSYLDRRCVFDSKKSLKGTGIVVSELLTRKRSGLLRKTKETFGKDRVWTRDGKIFALNSKGKRMVIASDGDLVSGSEMPDAQSTSSIESKKYNLRRLNLN